MDHERSAGWVVALALALTPTLAANEQVAIQELFVGPPDDGIHAGLAPDGRAQYVMLRMTAAGQTSLTATFLRVEDQDGNVLGTFGTLTGPVLLGGSAGCTYFSNPPCPSVIIGTQAADDLFTFSFDKVVNGQPGRTALPARGGRLCFKNAPAAIVDCVAWGNFSCTPANCPAGPNTLHTGDVQGSNLCDVDFGSPAAAALGLRFGKSLTRLTFSCAIKENSTQFTLAFPKPRNDMGGNNDADADGDMLIDVLDCDDGTSTLLWRATEVQNEKVAGVPTSTIWWDPQSEMSGTGVTYDLVRGSLAELDGFTDPLCQAPNIGLNQTTDGEVPPAGEGYYYLGRAGQGPDCVGSWGSGANGSRDPALAGVCP